MARPNTVQRQAQLGSNTCGAVSAAQIAAALNNLGSDTQVFPMALINAKSGAAWTTAVGATPSGGVMGLATTPGSLLTGAQSNNTSVSDTAGFFITLPSAYVDGDPISVRVRAKVSAARFVAQTVAVSVKKFSDTGLGSELVTTTARTLTTSYADYDFVVTPTGLAAGDRLWIVVTAVGNDTGGSTNGTITISNVAIVCSAFG